MGHLAPLKTQCPVILGAKCVIGCVGDIPLSGGKMLKKITKIICSCYGPLKFVGVEHIQWGCVPADLAPSGACIASVKIYVTQLTSFLCRLSSFGGTIGHRLRRQMVDFRLPARLSDIEFRNLCQISRQISQIVG